MKKKKIWIVDDDAIYQIIIDKLIKKSEMFSDKSSFKNGQEAIIELNNLLNNEELLPDIILLDVNMPVMDGWEFMEEMKGVNSKINKKIAIYIVSSSIAPEDKTKSKNFEIFDYISKPISVEDIKSIAEK
nr:response regulator [uncultured Flavobacterium sp.]